jgi:hypothetical protein
VSPDDENEPDSHFELPPGVREIPYAGRRCVSLSGAAEILAMHPDTFRKHRSSLGVPMIREPRGRQCGLVEIDALRRIGNLQAHRGERKQRRDYRECRRRSKNPPKQQQDGDSADD